MRLQKLYETYRDRAEFFVVYVREAHPTDGWDLAEGNRDIRVADPATYEERCAVAGRCMADLGFTVPALVDAMDDAANLAYAGWPERLYVVGRDGAIAYAGGMGPFHFKPDELAKFLSEHLSNPDNGRRPDAAGGPGK